MKRIAILTSGGDAPGMNAAIRATTRAALGHGWEAYGVHNGLAGLMSDEITPLQARDVGGIIQRGGTVLGSARSPEFTTPDGREKGLAHLRRRGIDALVVIGGNGSQTGSHAVSAAGFAVVGVASTIDNDLAGTDITIGADTAVNITMEAIDRPGAPRRHRTSAPFWWKHMGRNCGYIALMAGIAGGAEMIVIPESEVEPHAVAESLRAAYDRGKTHALVVVAEGAKNGARAIMQHFTEHRDTIGFALRVTTLGHVARGGAPTAADRVLATRLGAAAVDQLAQGRHGVLVGMRCGEICTTPLSEIAGTTKPANLELLKLARVLAR